jgi:hypothetical protein
MCDSLLILSSGNIVQRSGFPSSINPPGDCGRIEYFLGVRARRPRSNAAPSWRFCQCLTRCPISRIRLQGFFESGWLTAVHVRNSQAPQAHHGQSPSSPSQRGGGAGADVVPSLTLELTRFGRRCWGKRTRRFPNAANLFTICAGVPAANRRIGAPGAAWPSWRASSRPRPTPSVNGSSRRNIDEGLRSDGLTTSEREALNRLRRENRVLREEREILSKAVA